MVKSSDLFMSNCLVCHWLFLTKCSQIASFGSNILSLKNSLKKLYMVLSCFFKSIFGAEHDSTERITKWHGLLFVLWTQNNHVANTASSGSQKDVLRITNISKTSRRETSEQVKTEGTVIKKQNQTKILYARQLNKRSKRSEEKRNGWQGITEKVCLFFRCWNCRLPWHQGLMKRVLDSVLDTYRQ